MSIYLYQALMGLSSGLLYFLTAAGMAIIVSGLNVINFGQGAFCMFGTLLCYSVYRMTGSFFLGLLAAIVVSGLFGGYVTEAMLRPIYKRPALFQLLLTMGVGYILQDFFLLAWGNTMVTASIPKALDFRINLIGMPFPFYYIFLIIISLCICAVMLYVFKKTKVGMIFRAIITNREMVDCMGINVKVMNSLMFMVGISLTALAGALNLPVTGTQTAAESPVLFTAMAVLIIGGIEEIRGAFIGALIVGMCMSFGAMFFSQYYSLIPSLMMVLILLIKPEGICGKKIEAK